MKNNRYLEILIGGAFALLFIVYISDLLLMNEYIIIRPALNYKESMVDLMPQEVETPYSLLDGVLPLKDIQKGGSMNSQRCYDGDFQTRLEKTGNYIQRTNNYRHEDAESCTSPFQEFVTAYYDVKPLSPA